MVIALYETNAMVSIPAVTCRFLDIVRDRSCQVEWGECVVYFPTGIFIQCLEIYCSARFTVSFTCHYHTAAPSDRCIAWEFSDLSYANVHVQAVFNVIKIVDCNWNCLEVGNRDSIGVYHQFHGWARHVGGGLMRTYVECTGSPIT